MKIHWMLVAILVRFYSTVCSTELVQMKNTYSLYFQVAGIVSASAVSASNEYGKVSGISLVHFIILSKVEYNMKLADIMC